MNRITVGLLALALAGCTLTQPASGPQYHTEYLYEGPGTGEGQACVVRCEKVKERCRMSAQSGGADRYKLCEAQAQDEYESCAMRTTSFSERRLCFRKACPVSPDYVSCETPYQACFENCGGLVWSRRVCDANC